MRYGSVIVLLHEYQYPVYKVAINGHQLAVVAGLEIFPGEVIVFGFGCIGTKYVPKNIFLVFVAKNLFWFRVFAAKTSARCSHQ